MNAFYSKYNTKRAIDTLLENTKLLMQQKPAETGSAIIEQLRTYAEAILISNYPAIQEEITTAYETYNQAKMRFGTADAAQLEEAGNSLARKKAVALSKIVDDHPFIHMNESQTSFELTRMGAKAILRQCSFLKN